MCDWNLNNWHVFVTGTMTGNAFGLVAMDIVLKKGDMTGPPMVTKGLQICGKVIITGTDTLIMDNCYSGSTYGC